MSEGKSLNLVIRNFNRIKDAIQIRRMGLDALRRAAQDLRDKFAAASPVGATVQLRDGWVLRESEDYIVIANTKRYAKPVERGRRAAPIPVREALIRWVWQKLSPRDERQARAMAFGISRKAREQEKPGQHFVDRVLQDELPTKKVQAAQVITRSLQEYLDR